MRRLLYENWSWWRTFYKVQPLDYIKTYFGEKIGLYFTWLGFYTSMLFLPSIIGFVVFIYGVATINQNVIAEEGCDKSNNFTMCPLCNSRCPYWPYSAVCADIRASHMFDNGATVFFTCFMSLWGTVFLELWKRKQASLQFQWNLFNYEEEEEPPRPEYLVKLANSQFKKKHRVSGIEEPYLPFWRRKVPIYLGSVSTVIFMCLVALSFVFGVIAYRMTVRAALYLSENPMIYNNAGIVTSATAACLNLLVILILNYLYGKAAVCLTDMECHRTQSNYDYALNFKIYILKFVNFYSSLIYIAFFKSRFTGYPGDYNTLFGARQEEDPDKDDNKKKLKPWEKDYLLDTLGPRGLYEEYLEMLIQFGFVTLFVAAFPLAPLCALLNNIIEIRSDAGKLTKVYRRPVAITAKNIGVWYSIMYGIAKIAIVSNAFIIAFTSSFVQRLVYQYAYSLDHSYHGYTNNSLAYFNVSDFEPGNNKYDYTKQHWNTVAAQFALVVVYQNVILMLTNFIAHIIPDMPGHLEVQHLQEKHLVNEMIIKTELKHAMSSNAAGGSDNEVVFKPDLRPEVELKTLTKRCLHSDERCSTSEV
ncbi:hypothetical protein LSH36_569g02023 [Paralvinella palmiformis]|uniref:Anoctamin n=1 Tax=Paralvinella palmiformis TaxID=53620 RepID=A0AAD9J636_9ANNE|nr:hypothetical protein LSH36_569g02023 [Paralvinella palmiformis]